MPRKFKDNATTRPNLGLYLDRPSIDVPKRGLVAGNNFRIKDGKITNSLIGHSAWNSIVLNGPVMLIDLFEQRSGINELILGSRKDLYLWNDGTTTLTYLTPIYATGTITVGAGTLDTVDGSGTSWMANAKAGDEISFGSATENSTTATWFIIDTVDSNIKITLTTDATAQSGGTSYTIRKLYTGTKKQYWSTETFLNAALNQDYWYATNEADEIQRWDGNADQVTDMGSTFDFKCKVLRRYKSMMIYGNLTLDAATELRPTSFKNSAIGAPENTTTKEAGEFVIHDGAGHISSLQVLGDSLMLYSDAPGPQVLAQFVAEPLRFAFRTVLEKSAPLSGRAIANFGNFHEFISADGALWRWNGISKFEVGPQVWREVIKSFDPDRTAHAEAAFDDRNGEVIWLIPLTSDTDSTSQAETIYAEHFLELTGRDDPVPFSSREGKFMTFGTFERSTAATFSSLTQTFASTDFRWNDQFFAATFPILLAGDEDGKIYSLNDSGDFDGSSINSFVRFGRKVAVDGRQKAMLPRIYPFAEKRGAASYTMDVTLYSTDQVGGDITSQGTLGYDMTQAGNRFVNPYKVVRFFEIEFGTDGVGEGWELDGYDFDLIATGAGDGVV